MEATLPLPFLPSFDLGTEPAPQQGLTTKQLKYLGCIFLTATDQNINTLIRFLEDNVSIDAYVDASNLTTLESITNILDAGAREVWVGDQHEKALEMHKGRVYRCSNPQADDIPDGLLMDLGNDVASFENTLRNLKVKFASSVFLTTTDDDLESFVKMATDCSYVPIIPSSKLTFDTPSRGQISVPDLIGKVWVTDRSDKLISTVVTDARGIALGFVYSSQESLAESLRTGTGVYQSRKRGLWYKGATSGDTQELIRIYLDCDRDCLKFVVRQHGGGFCHLPQTSCFGPLGGISKLEQTLRSRIDLAPEGSYTKRLFTDGKLLRAKIMEEAEELCNARTKSEVAFEAADLIYFAMTKAASVGVSLADIEDNLDAKSWKVRRRKGDAKGQWAEKEDITNSIDNSVSKSGMVNEAASVPKHPTNQPDIHNGRIQMKHIDTTNTSTSVIQAALQRPSQKSTEAIMGIVKPIIDDVRTGGDKALLKYTHKFENATSLTSPVLKAPFAESLMQLPQETIEAINVSFNNIRTFHMAQRESAPLAVETMPGIVCSRFSRPITRVGLYVPGGTAVLPSTAMMLGIPAMVAGCSKIVLASPPRSDGSITPEIVYIAHKIGAEAIVLAGGAQAIAAMAYGTESVSKVDKILGPGNQFVTAAKMHVSNDTNAGVSIDMPAGPSEILVVADQTANPVFVAADLLSQAEHGVDSQVILITAGLSDQELQAIDDEIHKQALELPRVDIVRRAIEHSVTFIVKDIEEAMRLSNDYAPEHLSLQVDNAAKVVEQVQNAGSIFVGHWTPESVGDYSAGVNHSLPTYGYAKQYSGVNLASYVKHITSSDLTEQGLRNVGKAVMQMAKVEELDAHRRAVSRRLGYLDRHKP